MRENRQESAATVSGAERIAMKKAQTWMIPMVAVLALSPLACSTTTFESTWRAPDAEPLRLQGAKVVALFLSKNPTVRRRAEDAMAREITARGAQGVPAYTVLSEDEVKDQEASRARLESLGFGGTVVMRIVGRETQYSYQPATVWVRPAYQRFWGGYWRYGWGTVYEPGYLVADKVVKFETLVYSFRQDQLVWAGVSRTVDPAKIDSFITELAAAVSDQMAKDGLLTKG